MDPEKFMWGVSLGLFVGMLLCAELGYWLGRREMRADPERGRMGTGIIEAALLGLLGLILAFAFSGASSRLASRRELIIREANAMGTAYLRVDVLPADAQPEMRDRFKRYVEQRLQVYRTPDLQTTLAEQAKAEQMQQEIWRAAQIAAQRQAQQQGNAAAPLLLLPALNEMFDSANARMWSMRIHMPQLVVLLLVVVALASAVVAGYTTSGGGGRSWLHGERFALVVSATMYVVLDLEFPRYGVIRINDMDQMLVEVRKGMG